MNEVGMNAGCFVYKNLVFVHDSMFFGNYFNGVY